MNKKTLVACFVLVLSILSCQKENSINAGGMQAPEKVVDTLKNDDTTRGNSTDSTRIPPTPPSTPIDKNSSQDNNNKQFVYKALIEEVTATWCPYCPRVIRAIEQVKAVPNYGTRALVVAIHSRDPMGTSQSTAIRSFFSGLPDSINLTGLPYFIMNRKQLLFASNAAYNVPAFLENKTTSPIGIKIQSTLSETKGKVTVEFKTTEDISGLKYHIAIIENKIIASQNDNGVTKSHFEHNYVLRSAYSYIKGTDLPTLKAGEEVTITDKEFDYTLQSADKLKNVRVVVYISDEQGEILNAQEAMPNTTQDYEYAL